MDRPTTKVVARFFDYVQITKHCWLWLGHLNHNGYGLFRFNKGRGKAHRFSYALFVGPIEPGKHILHRRECGNPSCVNPNHLYMGTNADNVRDRMMWGKSRGYGLNAKLSESDVLYIRKIKKNLGGKYGLNRDLAKQFGIGAEQVRRISNGQAWKHLPL